MASGYGYGYDANSYSAYAGYAAAQYSMIQQQQQQPSGGNTADQVGYGTPRTAPPAPVATSNTVGYGLVYPQQYPPAATPQYSKPQTPSSSVLQATTVATSPAQYPYNYAGYQYPGYTPYRPPSYPPYVPSVSSNAPSVTTPTPPRPSIPYKPVGYGQPQTTQTQSYTVAYPHASTYQHQYPSYTPTPATTKTTSYAGGTGGVANTSHASSDMTPQQQQVVQQFLQQKVQHGANTAIKNFIKKTPKYQSPEQFYCSTCKVSCGGPQAYQAHLIGKNHKKRVQQLERTKGVTETTSNPFKCDVCEIFCSNHDAFQAHVKGAKHLKTVNLFRKLGKPLPTMTSSVNLEGGGVTVSAPRITFVGGKKLSSTGMTISNNDEDSVQVYPPGAPQPAVKESTSSLDQEEGVSVGPEVQPVGENLIKPIKGDPRNPHATYICELCDCFFCDDLARTIHCKGRRHRLNYKKTYQPDLIVEPPKAQVRQRMKAESARTVFGRGRGRGWSHNRSWRSEEYTREPYPVYDGGYEEGQWEGGWDDPYLPPRNPMDDKVISIKHETLRPDGTEMGVIHSTVEFVERALKMVSDDLLIERCKMLAKSRGEEISDIDAAKDESNREVKGVMRVGLFARSILLKGQANVKLVVMCNNKPTFDLLETVYTRLPSKFAKLNCDQVFNVAMTAKQSEMSVVSSIEDHTVTVRVGLTSSLMREEHTPEMVEADAIAGVLNKECCLLSLAELRHTKWFQAMCHGLPSFNYTMRLFLDLGRRHPVWRVLDQWMLELLVQKCIASANPDFVRPGDIFRRVIECIASGVFLPGGRGLQDPCEKGCVDAAAELTAQERADLTLTAQHYLRLIAYNQLHLVLDVTPPTDYAPYSLGRCVKREEEEAEEDGDPSQKRIKTDC